MINGQSDDQALIRSMEIIGNTINDLKLKYFTRLVFTVFVLFKLLVSHDSVLRAEPLDLDITRNPAPATPSQATPPLKIVYCPYMPLYFKGANGMPRGILVDFWKQWSIKVKIPVTFSLLPWQACLDAIKNGTADINAMIYSSSDRDPYFDFSQSFLDLSTYLYHSVDVRPMGTTADLQGHLVGVVNGDYTMVYLKKNKPHARIKVYDKHEDLIIATLNGEIDLFAMEAPVASTYLAKHDALEKIHQVTVPLYSKQVHAGVPRGNQELLTTVNKGLNAFTQDEIDGIIRNWTGNPRSWEWQANAHTIKIATSVDNIPFHFVDENGKTKGMLVDMWRLWAKKTGNEVAFVSVPWAESLDMVKRGDANIHAGCFYSAQRDDYLDFANPFLTTCETHFFFHESIFGLKHLEDLFGFKIGIVKQDYAVEFMNRELPGTALVEYDSHRALFEGVKKAEVKVFVSDTPVALYLLAKKELLHKFQYHPSQPLYKKSFYAAVQEGNQGLISQINEGFKNISPEERVAITRRWMGTSGNPSADHLVVALARDFAPFSMLNANGQPSGMFVDMWKICAKSMGAHIEFRIMDRSDAVKALKDGIVDILCTLPNDVVVQDWVSFSDPWYPYAWHIYLADDQIHGETLQNLIKNQAPLIKRKASATTGKWRVGAVRDTWIFGWLGRFVPPQVGIIGFDSTQEMILAAQSGKVDVFVGIPPVISNHLNQLGMPRTFKMVETPLVEKQIKVAVRNYNPDLISRINKGMADLLGQQPDEIRQKWLSHGGRALDPVYVRKMVLRIIFGSGVLLLLIFLWHRQVRQREGVMRKAREAAEAANRAKSEFLAGLSHEVRTPLNAILGMTEITLQSPLNTHQIKNLNVVKTSARHLLGIINDILDLSTIESGKLKIQEQAFDLDQLVEDIHHTYRFSEQARKKNLDITLKKIPDTLGHYRGDPLRLRQILGNLMDNAVKFTPQGSVGIIVEKSEDATTDKDKDKDKNKLGTLPPQTDAEDSSPRMNDAVTPCVLVFNIWDTGIGIPLEKQERVFDSFTQAEGSTTRKYGGTGLGLAICRETARFMGGTIELESTPGQGSRFVLQLPLKKTESTNSVSVSVSVSDSDSIDASALIFKNKDESLKSPGGTEPHHPLLVLLVEDCPVNAEVAREYLALLGHRVIVAEEGHKAMEALQANDIDLILMDIEMPVMDGLSVTRQIRKGVAGEKNKSLPIVAMTAHVLEEYRQKSLEAGMNDFLPKPVDISSLKAVLETNRLKGATATHVLPELDEEGALQLFARNHALLKKIYGIFLTETPALVETVEQALQAKDTEAVRFSAHTLKGACARICAMASRQAFERLEKAGTQTSDWPVIEVAADDALSELKKVMELLEAKL